MGLYDRLIGTEEPKLPVHQFMAVLAERRRGQLTNQQVGDMLNLSLAERTDILTLVSRIGADLLSAVEVHDVLLLAEAGWAPYQTVLAVTARLGV